MQQLHKDPADHAWLCAGASSEVEDAYRAAAWAATMTRDTTPRWARSRTARPARCAAVPPTTSTAAAT
jgi:hypothetical protein